MEASNTLSTNYAVLYVPQNRVDKIHDLPQEEKDTL